MNGKKTIEDRPHVTYAAVWLSITIISCFCTKISLNYAKESRVIDLEIEKIQLDKKEIELKIAELTAVKTEGGTKEKAEVDKEGK